MDIVLREAIRGYELSNPTILDHVIGYSMDDAGFLNVELDNGTVDVYDDSTQSSRCLPLNSEDLTREQFLTEFVIRTKRIMLRRGYTQRKLSELIGISENTFSGYMSGRREPSLYVVDRIATILNCSVDSLRYTGPPNRQK